MTIIGNNVEIIVLGKHGFPKGIFVYQKISISLASSEHLVTLLTQR
jgi:hypothetical protein